MLAARRKSWTIGMPHVIDVDEKEPFLQEQNGEQKLEDLYPSHNHLNSSKSCYGNGDVNGGVVSGDIGTGGEFIRAKADHVTARNASARSVYMMRVLSAVFYAVASFLITVINKVVLTSYR